MLRIRDVLPNTHSTGFRQHKFVIHTQELASTDLKHGQKLTFAPFSIRNKFIKQKKTNMLFISVPDPEDPYLIGLLDPDQ